MKFKSTRNSNNIVSPSLAIIQGLASDGGLFVPTHMPKLSTPLDTLVGKSYQEVAYAVMKEFLTDFTEDELKYCIDSAYDSKFDTEEIAPLVQVGDAYYLELFHGKTIAFKDMALSILPYLMITSAKKNNIKEKIVILTATSGDTGKAALAGFGGVDGTEIIVFYPRGGVSKIQELQMVTTKESNTHVISVNGNFDDCQTGVKNIFNNEEFKKELLDKGYRFSSANSINVGRLVPQVAYYVWAYLKLVQNNTIKIGDKINITVPTGNFGNILAAYYAKKMGMPFNKLICASNSNKVLFDFFKTGEYNRNREFVLTSSPSMDILISSNLERLIYEIVGSDSTICKTLMEDLVDKGDYQITNEMKSKLTDFVPGYATEENTFETIKSTYEKHNYVMDTHTAVAGYVYNNYRRTTNDLTPCVIASTASPYKFTPNVMAAIDPKYKGLDPFDLIDKLHELSGIDEPLAIKEIRDGNIMHNINTDTNKMLDIVKNILGI